MNKGWRRAAVVSVGGALALGSITVAAAAPALEACDAPFQTVLNQASPADARALLVQS